MQCIKMRKSPKKYKAVFLDRDGTLIHDRPGHYLRSPENIKFYRGTVPALRLLKSLGYRLIVLTNQSGIELGYLTLKTLNSIHRKIFNHLKKNQPLFQP